MTNCVLPPQNEQFRRNLKRKKFSTPRFLAACALVLRRVRASRGAWLALGGAENHFPGETITRHFTPPRPSGHGVCPIHFLPTCSVPAPIQLRIFWMNSGRGFGGGKTPPGESPSDAPRSRMGGRGGLRKMPSFAPRWYRGVRMKNTDADETHSLAFASYFPRHARGEHGELPAQANRLAQARAGCCGAGRLACGGSPRG